MAPQIVLPVPARIEVLGPGGDVVDVVELPPGDAVRLLHPTVRLIAGPGNAADLADPAAGTGAEE